MPVTHTLKVEDEKSSGSSQGRTERPSGEAAFALDTSGYVTLILGANNVATQYQWRSISPFKQGYVEAMNAAHPVIGNGRAAGSIPGEQRLAWGFSDLAPETLAAILKDCTAFQKTAEWVAWNETMEGNLDEDGADFAAGQAFWMSRNRQVPGFLMGPWPEPFATELWTAATDGFPSLTLTLGDDGKVRASLAKQEG